MVKGWMLAENENGAQTRRVLIVWLSIFSAIWVTVAGFLLTQYQALGVRHAELAERVTRLEERLEAQSNRTTEALRGINSKLDRVFEIRLREERSR